MLNKKLDFLIVGAQKSGTSALRQFLRYHPEIFMPYTELHFFDNDKNFKETPNYDKYHARFSFKKDAKVVGESTPIYMYWPQGIERIHTYNPDIKLIAILRNTYERAYSHYKMERRRRIEPFETFKEALAAESARLAQGGTNRRYFSYMDRGNYSVQIKRILQYFPPEQLLILENSELKNNHDNTLKKIFNYLGVDDKYTTPHKMVHRNIYKPMENQDIVSLKTFYKNDIQELEKITNWDCTSWYT